MDGKIEGHSDPLSVFVRKAGVAPRLTDTGISGVVGEVKGYDRVRISSGRGDVEVLQARVSTLHAAAATQPRKTDAEVADENYANSSVHYKVFLLTSFSDDAGSNGPFYLQLQGDLGVTDLHTIYPNASRGQWSLSQIYDSYVGRMRTIRIAAGTSNGWKVTHILILYPRGHVWVLNDLWVDTDSREVLEINF